MMGTVCEFALHRGLSASSCVTKLRVLLSGMSGWTHLCTESSRSQQCGGTMVSLLV